MFKKQKCSRCGKKTNYKNDFCPNCGNPLKENKKQENLGMLGKNDFFEENISENPFDMVGGGMLGKMLGSAMKMLEKELQKAQTHNPKEIPVSNVELFINGKRINPGNIRVSKKIIKKPGTKQIPKKDLSGLTFSSEKAKKFSKLKRKEPVTNIRRLANKIIYEIKMPGVTSTKDISLTQLENSIEIKAIGRDKAYYKVISLNFPIIDYKLSKGTFQLELEAKN